jgi:hypothetical protein
MIALLRFAVPWALLAVFVVGAFRWRILLLGIPFLIAAGAPVFFDSMRLFHTPARLSGSMQVLLWLVIVWAVTTGRLLPRSASAGSSALPDTRGRRFLPEELTVAALAALVLGHMLAGALRTGDFAAAAGRGLDVLTMVVGYFLVRDIVGHATREESVRFLAALVLVNAFATLLFILHQGLHVGVYSVSEYFTFAFGGKVLTRTFTIAPPFLVLSLAFVLARRRWTVGWTLVLVCAVVGIAVSYTRTLVVLLIVTLLVTLLARQLKRPAAGRLIKSALVLALLAVGLVWGVMTFIPTETRYFGERLSGLVADPTASADSSFAFRSQFLASTVRIVDRGDLLFGFGFPSRGGAPSFAQVETWSWDMAWISVLYRFGVAGVLVFVAMFVGFGARAFRIFMSGSGDSEYLGLLFFAAIICAAVETGISQGFMEPGVFPLALWMFAFVAAEARRTVVSPDGAMLPAKAVSVE